MEDVGYLYFRRDDYEFIKTAFPNIYTALEQFVINRVPEVELQVNDEQTDMLDNKILMAIGESATSPTGDPSKQAIKLEHIWEDA